MSIGSTVRRVFGEKNFRAVGEAYRKVFVDLDAVADALAPLLPMKCRLLDVGGGDGAPLNHILRRRPDVEVVMIDPSPSLGGWIEKRFQQNVTVYPSTSISSFLASESSWRPDAIFVGDVLHHVPSLQRPAFLDTLARFFSWAPEATLVIKDVEPGYFRSHLGLLSDRYVTGDRGVSLVSRSQVVSELVCRISRIVWTETSLFAADPPNYAIEFHR